MTILVIAEHDNQKLKPATRHVIQAAQELPGSVKVVVLGDKCQAVSEEAASCAGVETVLLADHPSFAHPIAETFIPTLQTLAEETKYVLAPSSTFGKNLIPRLAAVLDVAPLTDVLKIQDESTFVRPIYAGNALATVRCPEPIKLMTIRITAFEGCASSSSPVPINPVTIVDSSSLLPQFIKLEKSKSERPELGSANVIIAGGRGLQSKEKFKLIETLADQLNAAIGASRAAVDAGFVPNDYQVGQTGKVVAPDLYIAIGISGAIQHLAGMKDSKVIVAINKDPGAPIFQVADYGLVGDLFDIIPKLTEKFKNLKQASQREWE